MKNILKLITFSLFFILFICSFGCAKTSNLIEQTSSRESKIPINAIKMTPKTDSSPPKSNSSEYYDPEPLPTPINTAGGEDSAFILPDGETLYFWFTPDVNISAEKQLSDGVTGIYVSKKEENSWNTPQRIRLQDANKISLDGCSFVLNETMWFCSAREGVEGLGWFTANFNQKNYKWENWKIANFPKNYEVGELHIYDHEVYFHSAKSGGKGGLDIWTTKQNEEGDWLAPINLLNINSDSDEGWPALSPNGDELWISKNYGLWRSKKIGEAWTKPELMFSPLAGEASIDKDGNVYFSHHFFENGKMIEADIYVARKKDK